MSPQRPTKQPADGPKGRPGFDLSARRPPVAREWDREVAQIAGRQHGLVSLEQLEGMGMGRGTAHRRVEAGRLHRLHEGVYAVGHTPRTGEARYMSAVLACGPDAVLSHRSAADLWGLRESRRGRIDVTAPGRRGRAPREIDAHRDGSLTAVDRTVEKGIPCTTVARTLLDLAAVVPVWDLRRTVGEAEVLRALDKGAAWDLIKRSRGRRGVARLRMLLDELHPDTGQTRSYMERLFLGMCTRAQLPAPEVNVTLHIGGDRLKPDFLWRQAALIVEADSRRFHDTDMAFLDDRRREQRLQLVGWRVTRCTWWEIKHESRRLAETIRGLILVHQQPMGRNVDPGSTYRPIDPQQFG
jgi:predicted transcriptional regulator of viral defense system